MITARFTRVIIPKRRRGEEGKRSKDGRGEEPEKGKRGM
jgi:hypothetical protein